MGFELPFCPQCRKRNPAGAEFCSKCGESLSQTDSGLLGTVSLILGFIAIVTCFIPIFLFGILASIFEAVAYYGKHKDPLGRTGLKFGIISVIANVFVWIFLIFVLWPMLAY